MEIEYARYLMFLMKNHAMVAGDVGDFFFSSLSL